MILILKVKVAQISSKMRNLTNLKLKYFVKKPYCTDKGQKRNTIEAL